MFRIIVPSLMFYAQAVFHIGRAARKARRGELDNVALVDGSHALRRSLENVGVSFEVTGLDQVDWTAGPYVFAANHMSALETQILPSILHQAAPCTFVVKSSLLKYPGFGPVLKAFDPIDVGRVDARADLRRVLDEGTARLKAGKSVIVFPQAHRTPDFSRKAFNSIGARLARAADVPIVPIALDTAAWRPGKWLQDIGWIDPSQPVRFSVGQPIATAGATIPQTHEQVVCYIESTIAAWRQSAPPEA